MRGRTNNPQPAGSSAAHPSSAEKALKTPDYGKRRNRSDASRDFARRLRKRSTAAEKQLWQLLRDHRFNEFKFRRQYACGSYFLDFYCSAAKLAVELDGGGHGFPDQRTRDEKRNGFLMDQGIRVLRFWNHQLRNECEAVRFEIWHALLARTGRTGARKRKRKGLRRIPERVQSGAKKFRRKG